MIPIKRNKHGIYMVTDLLEKGPCTPVVHHVGPRWVPEDGPVVRSLHKSCHVPALGWHHTTRDIPEGTPLVDVDANGAYLSACSSADFAHCTLEHTGPMAADAPILPGYYLTEVLPWQLGAPGSPLGTQDLRIGSLVWVTHCTLCLLRDLTFGANWGAQEGHWPALVIHDSWTADRMRFTKRDGTGWTDVIRDKRAALIAEGADQATRDGLKNGYSQAVQMWLTPPDPKGTPRERQKKKNIAYRPDWYHTVHSQHAAKMWRIAYLASLYGRAPLAVGGGGGIAKDGMRFVEDDLTAFLTNPKANLRLDETGVKLGTFKRKGQRTYHGIDW